MSKLLILGNTNVYTFCNSILGANEKSKEIFDGESISEIYVIHSPESFNELFVKNNDEENGNTREWIDEIEKYGIKEDFFIHKTILNNDTSMETFFKYVKKIFEFSQLDKLIIDLTNGMSEFKTTLAIAAYIVGQPRTFHIDISKLQAEMKGKRKFLEIEILKKYYKEIIPGRKIDEIAYMNLTEVVRYEDQIEKLTGIYSNFEIEEVNNPSFFKNNLLNAIRLKIKGDQKGIDEEETYYNSMYRISSTAMASSLEDIIDRFLISYKINDLKNSFTLGQKIHFLEKAIHGKCSKEFDYNFFEKFNEFMLYLRNSTTHKALNISNSEKFKTSLSLHMLFVFVEYYSKIIYTELKNINKNITEKERDIVTLDEFKDSKIRYYGLDGDNTGSALERLFDRNVNENEIKKFSNSIKKVKENIVSYIKKNYVKVIFSEGDDILFKGQFKIEDLQKMLSLYRDGTGMTCSIGYGDTLKETLFSMKIAKLEKNSIKGYRIRKE